MSAEGAVDLDSGCTVSDRHFSEVDAQNFSGHFVLISNRRLNFDASNDAAVYTAVSDLLNSPCGHGGGWPGWCKFGPSRTRFFSMRSYGPPHDRLSTRLLAVHEGVLPRGVGSGHDHIGNAQGTGAVRRDCCDRIGAGR